MNATPAPSVHRRFRRRGAVLFTTLIIALLIIADLRGCLLHRQVDDMAAYHGQRAVVSRIIDGDTLEVQLADAMHARQTTRIALIGVNCPEPAKAGVTSQPLADEAAAFTAARCRDTSVILWLEAHQTRDPFGRVLAHVELADGIMLNEALLESGFATIDERWPHSMLIRYAQLETQARRKGVGLWAKPHVTK